MKRTWKTEQKTNSNRDN